MAAAGGGSGGAAVFEYARSCDVNTPLRLHIRQFQGKRATPSISEIVQNPELRLAGSFAKPNSDLQVACQVFCDGMALALPTRTPYKSFHNGTTWDEWLELPVPHSTLLRDACIAITIWDVQSPRKEMVVGGAALQIFRADGRVRQGHFTLRVTEGISGEEMVKRIGSEPVNELVRLERLVRKKVAGEIEPVPWLDPTSMRRTSSLIETQKEESGATFISVSLPTPDVPIVYSEVAGDLAKQLGGAAIIDPEILYHDNLLELKHHKLTREQKRDYRARDLKPNPATRDLLAALTARPPTEPISIDEKDLIWRFRYYLSKDKKALTKFLRCIAWHEPAEAKQALELLEQWDKIDVDDALELLGKTFTARAVRSYAVERLDSADADELCLYLLQLVQALKYEPLVTRDGREEMTAPITVRDDGVDKPHKQSRGAPEPVADMSTPVGAGLAPTSLAGFLVKRALEDRRLGSFLYWYLLVECKDKGGASTRLYTRVYSELIHALETGTPDQRDLRAMLRRQKDFLAGLRNVSNDLKDKSAGNRLKKIETLKTILRDTPQFRSFEPLSLPLDADIVVTGIKWEDAFVFKSALNPLKITFTTQKIGPPYSLIYKNGDDLRQDQLCLQILLLFDKLLKAENLDLKLTPYRTIATSADIGMVEMVHPSEPIASILKEHGGIQKYLQKHNRDESAPFMISKDAMDTYVKSCAGYCVYTYLLGIGDRHFDNLMMTPNGHLFHIDFGFILGRDPKPYPPPMKLTKEMVEAMGGEKSEELKKFRSHCYSAFLILRKHANLVLNLFSLMVDSSVHDIQLDPDKTVQKVQEKFMLELTDEQAVKAMQDLIDQSVSAMFAQFVERIHTWAQYWRK